jgi:NDP-sugar pyrophosphorylase family protein
MKAMILAAGLGTRLRPLTDDRPKALVELEGRTLLEINLSRLRDFGITEVVINVHHFSDKVIDYLTQHNNFGMDLTISREDKLLDTGGGLKNAGWFFSGNDDPFILHNVDILSDFDLAAMLEHHNSSHALATLAVQSRVNNRPLLFNAQGQLRGYSVPDRPAVRVPTKSCITEALQPLAFAGIHIVSPRIFSIFTEQGAFPIIPAYLRIAATGEPIGAFRQDDAYWRDLGTFASLQRAAEDVRERPGLLPPRLQ